MPKSIQITIPTPCHEKWAEMTPVDKGRFCASCQKTVIDFTRASDREIAQALRTDKHLCGRFMSSQLERDLIIPKEKSSLWAAVSAAVLTFLTIGSYEASAQAVKTEQTDRKADNIKAKNNTDSWIISGTVSDSIGPLPGASIIIKDTQVSTQSDINGNYTIEAKKGDILEFYFVGYNTANIVANNNNKICVVLEENMTSHVVGIFVEKRTFFGRIFHSIGNWFR